MLDRLLQVLGTTGYPFTAYRWDHCPPAPYGTAQLEGGADSVAADDRIIQQGIRASVDLYAPSAQSSYPSAVQSVLDGAYAWRLNSVQYEDDADTHLVHYEWIVESEGL